MKTTDITTILTADLNQGCVEAVVTAALAHGYVVLLTADHGNADYAVNEDGALCNVAPTILKLMDIPQPEAMTAEPMI